MQTTLTTGPLGIVPTGLQLQRYALPEGGDLSHLLRSTVLLHNETDTPLACPLLPTGGVTLLFSDTGAAQLCGPLSGARHLTLAPMETVYGAELQWGCGDWLWSGALTALENTLTPLEPLLPGSDRLGGALHRCTTRQEQNALMGRLLSLHGGRQYQCAPLLRRLLDEMQERRGQIRVAELAQELGCSERYLNRLLRQKVGLSTKTVGELLQLRQMLELLDKTRPKSLLHAAVACGYFDQAHMNRHCRRFLGCSASALRLPEGRLTPLL